MAVESLTTNPSRRLFLGSASAVLGALAPPLAGIAPLQAADEDTELLALGEKLRAILSPRIEVGLCNTVVPLDAESYLLADPIVAAIENCLVHTAEGLQVKFLAISYHWHTTIYPALARATS